MTMMHTMFELYNKEWLNVLIVRKYTSLSFAHDAFSMYLFVAVINSFCVLFWVDHDGFRPVFTTSLPKTWRRSRGHAAATQTTCTDGFLSQTLRLLFCLCTIFLAQNCKHPLCLVQHSPCVKPWIAFMRIYPEG